MNPFVQKIFLPYTPEELEQRKTGQWIKEFEGENLDEQDQQFKLDDLHLFQENNILIRQHRRFAYYPLHSHHFLEFNYMYCGTSEQIVNGLPITLKEGQLLLLDTNSRHELMPLGGKDILLNFLFKTNDININLLKKIDNRSGGLTYNFLMNAILEPGYNETHLLLHLSKEPEIQVTLDQMILEYFSKKHLGNEIMNAFSQVLFLQLSRVYHSQLAKIYKKDGQSNLMIKILQRIESDYRTLNLKTLADELGYNPNYLSNLIKQQTGKSFKQLITNQRLHEAQDLILSTRFSIEEIAASVGFSNKTHFYKKYREYFGDTPIAIRKQR